MDTLHDVHIIEATIILCDCCKGEGFFKRKRITPHPPEARHGDGYDMDEFNYECEYCKGFGRVRELLCHQSIRDITIDEVE